ncbi:MAG: nucleoside deaminase [bacterium]|nr:nucleoside deaminase [bacterium]MCP4968069.1 nucleoside deaminase [bacterium]
MPDEKWIRETVRLALEARERGDEPFGALLVKDDAAILTARNAINTDRDVTQHAELRLISKGSRQLDPAVMAAATLYTSTEPCAMCAGAIYWSGISRMVFGVAATTLEERTSGSGLHQPSRQVLGSASRSIDVVGPVLETDAWSAHDGYW